MKNWFEINQESDVVKEFVPRVAIEGLDMLDIPSDAYHASPAVGHSSLVRIMRSPAHFRHYLDTPHEASPALEFGTAVHAAILEPELFLETYAVPPKFDRRTKDGKASAEKWENDNLGKRMLSIDQMAGIALMQKSVLQHKTAARYLEKKLVEKSFFWRDVDTGIECKFRPDVMMIDSRGEVINNTSQLDQVVGIVDVKTTLDASAGAFARSMAKYGYDLQAAFYSDPLSAFLGREIPFYELAIESSEPHACALYRVGERTMEIGRTKYRAALQLLQWCKQEGAWPGYQPFGDEEVIDVPHWERAVNVSDED